MCAGWRRFVWWEVGLESGGFQGSCIGGAVMGQQQSHQLDPAQVERLRAKYGAKVDAVLLEVSHGPQKQGRNGRGKRAKRPPKRGRFSDIYWARSCSATWLWRTNGARSHWRAPSNVSSAYAYVGA